MCRLSQDQDVTWTRDQEGRLSAWRFKRLVEQERFEAERRPRARSKVRTQERAQRRLSEYSSTSEGTSESQVRKGFTEGLVRVERTPKWAPSEGLMRTLGPRPLVTTHNHCFPEVN